MTQHALGGFPTKQTGRTWFQKYLTTEGRLVRRYKELKAQGSGSTPVAIIKGGPVFTDGRPVALVIKQVPLVHGGNWIFTDGEEIYTKKAAEVQLIESGKVLAGYK